jgi:hypothetical protein
VGFVMPKKARPGSPIEAGRQPVTPAPGAVASPQFPGQVPDRSSVPGEGVLPVVLPATPPRRPLTEYGSAQRIMRVFEPRDGNDDDPERFEQGPISYEELRKANPSLRMPLRPTAGYALSAGIRIPGKRADELNAPKPVAEIAPGE